MYKNVPTDIERKMPVIKSPDSVRSHPIAMPMGLRED